MEDKEERNVHDFLTVSELDNFNDKVNMVLNKKSVSDNEEAESNTEKELVEETVERETFVVNPTEIPDDLLYQLSDIIDGKTHFSNNDLSLEQIEGPSTRDKILGSIAVAYIMENNLPIAVALLLDPTIENYKKIIPNDYYEVKSGKSLEGRIQQEFFAFKPDQYSPELGKELKELIESNSPNLFIVSLAIDETTNRYLIESGYRLISEFKTDWEKETVKLWIN